MAAATPFDPVAHLRRYLLEGLSRSANVPFFAPDAQDPLLQPPPIPGGRGDAGADPQQDELIDEYSALIAHVTALPPATPQAQLEQYFGNVTIESLMHANRTIDAQMICLMYKTPDALNGDRILRAHGPFAFAYINETKGSGESELIKSVFGKVHYNVYSLDSFVNAALRVQPANLVAKPQFVQFVQQTLQRTDPVYELVGNEHPAVSDALPTGLLYLGTSTRTRPEHLLRALEPFPYANRSPWYNGVRYETVAALAKKRCVFPRKKPADDVAANLFVGLFVDAFVRTVMLIDKLRRTVSQTHSAICRDILERCSTSDKNALKTRNGNPSVRFYNRIVRYGCESDWWVCMNLALSSLANSTAAAVSANHFQTTVTTFVPKATHPANAFVATFADDDIARVARYGRGDYNVRLFKRKCATLN